MLSNELKANRDQIRVREVQIMSLWFQFNYGRVTRFQSDLLPLRPSPLAREGWAGGGGGGRGLEIEHQGQVIHGSLHIDSLIY